MIEMKENINWEIILEKKLTQYQIKLSPYRLYHSGRHAVTRVAHEILRMKGLDLIIYLINGRTI